MHARLYLMLGTEQLPLSKRAALFPPNLFTSPHLPICYTCSLPPLSVLRRFSCESFARSWHGRGRDKPSGPLDIQSLLMPRPLALQALENIHQERMGHFGTASQYEESALLAPALRKGIAVYHGAKALLGMLSPDYDELSKVTTPRLYLLLLLSMAARCMLLCIDMLGCDVKSGLLVVKMIQA